MAVEGRASRVVTKTDDGEDPANEIKDPEVHNSSARRNHHS